MDIHHRSKSGLNTAELMAVLSPFAAKVYGMPQHSSTSITEDSRKVIFGSLFIARAGEQVDGRAFCEAALAAGASAIICDKEASTSLEPRIEVDDLHAAWGAVALALAGSPQKQLALIGITGTNGKTSTAYLVQRALEYLQQPAARSGTLGFYVGNECLSESLTTPQPETLAQLLAKAVELGAQSCVMEVSSHALHQGRVKGLNFASVAFSNLTQDHLDYHGSLAAYQAAKERLFFEYAADCAVVNLDDPTGLRLAEKLKTQKKKVIGVSTQGHLGELSIDVSQLTADGFEAKVSLNQQQVRASSPLLGRHNLDNWALALGILCSLEIELGRAVDALAGIEGAPGRMERVRGPEGSPVVLVDFAHTPDALERAIQALRETGAKDIRLVFGCGGDRDQAKRFLMGKVATLADRVWVTSDNPRSEDPTAIIEQVCEGLKGSQTPYSCVSERREAMRLSFEGASAETVVLIAGKGHENYQIIGDQVIAFNDREEAERLLAELLLKKQEGE